MFKRSKQNSIVFSFEVRQEKLQFKISISCGSNIDEIWKIGKEMKMINVSPFYEIKDEIISFLLTEASFLKLIENLCEINKIKLGSMNKFI